MKDNRPHRSSPSGTFGGRASVKVLDQRSMVQERTVLAAGDHLQEALAWILVRHPDNDAKERGELVRSRPISADGHDRVSASSARDRSSSHVVAARPTRRRRF